MENRLIDIAVFAFVLFFIVPLVISAVLYTLGDRVKKWRTADRSSAGLLPPARADQSATLADFRHRKNISAPVTSYRRGSSQAKPAANCT
jgi:hypothetical protein